MQEYRISRDEMETWSMCLFPSSLTIPTAE